MVMIVRSHVKVAAAVLLTVVGALGWWMTMRPVSARWPAAELNCPRCPVVLVSVDTLRADHLGCYGYSRPTSPCVDAFSARAILFERAYAPSFTTADSHMSMFTGVYPSVHGVRTVWKEEPDFRPLDPGITTLPELLRASGYATAGFTGGGNVAPEHGFGRGMDVYEALEDDAARVDKVLAFARQQGSRPYFLFVHTYSVHDPYTPSPPWARSFDPTYAGRIQSDLAALRRVATSFDSERALFWSPVDRKDSRDVAHLVALYDGEIRQLDEHLCRLLDGLLTLHPRPLVVLTSDHGEQFAEHGGFLHTALYEELIHVPLLVWHPRLTRPGRVHERVSLVALMPTLLDLLGLPPAVQAQGRSLRSLLAGRAPDDAIFSEKAGHAAAYIRNGQKLILRRRRGKEGPERAELYELDRDPRETRNRAAKHLEGSGLREALEGIRNTNRMLAATLRPAQATATGVRPDEETVERLRALGYLP